MTSVFWRSEDINFQVNEGEVLGDIGKNGAGNHAAQDFSQVTEPIRKIEISW